MDSKKPEIKFGFIEMLFALVVGEIAVQSASLTVPTLLPLKSFPASYAHCVLSLLVVASTWVGWSRSQAPGHLKDTHTVLSPQFVVMVIDLLLVVVYFFIAKGVDVVPLKDGGLKEIASAQNETLWIMVTFAGYGLWDLLTKWDKLKERRFRESRTDATIGCVVIAIVTYCFLHDASSTGAVLLTDLAMASLVLLFRALKQPARGWSWFLGSTCGLSLVVASWVG